MELPRSLDDPEPYRPSFSDLEYMAKEIAYGRGLVDLPPGYVEGDTITGPQGFHAVPIAASGGEPVLAIRGTASPLDAVADFDLQGVGFEQAQEVWLNIREWLLDNPGAHITGHSLGGAQAQLIAAWATEAGIRIGQVATFNAPGIAAGEAARFDPSLSLGVVHHVSSGDVVSMVGEEYLPGELLYYRFRSIDFADPLFSQIVNAHVGHWARPEMWSLLDESGAIQYDQYPAPIDYQIASVSLTYEGLSDAKFSHLYSGDTPDGEYAAFLLSLARQGLAPVSTFLATRETAEMLRKLVGPNVIALVETATQPVGPTASLTLAAAARTIGGWSIESARSIADWKPLTWVGVASFGSAVWAEMRDWREETVQGLVGWTEARFNSVAEIGAAGVEKASEIGAAIGSALGSAGGWLGDRISDTRDALNWSKLNPLGKVETAGDGGGVVAATLSVLISGGAAATLKSTVPGSMFVAGEGNDLFDLTTGGNVIWGLPDTLNNDRVLNFGVTDALIYALPSISSVSLLPPQPGSAILSLDLDGDGEADTTITLEGDYDLDRFRLTVEDGNAVITYGIPEFDGDAEDDFIEGTIRADILRGHAGNDTLLGGPGNDELFGGDGADVLFGGPGDDLLDARGALEMRDAAGNIIGGQGNVLIPGAGNNTIIVRSALDIVDNGFLFIDHPGRPEAVNEIISHSDFWWDLYGAGSRLVLAEEAAGGHALSAMIGWLFDSEIVGNSGDNIIFTAGGDNVVRPGDGVDWIAFGVTEGYRGVDTLVIDKVAPGAPPSWAIVWDFMPGEDKVDVTDFDYSSFAQIAPLGFDDGAGNSYFLLGEGTDVLFFVGLTTSQVGAGDFIV